MSGNNKEEGPRRQLPQHAALASEALRDLKGLDKGAAATLLDAFIRRCNDLNLPREDEPLPIGKGKVLRSIRITYGGSEFRLVYFQVRPTGKSKERRPRSKKTGQPTDRPLRFVGLLAWGKKGRKLGTTRGKTGWDRSVRWLEQNLGYKRT